MSKHLPLCGLYQENEKYLSTEKIPEFVRVIFSGIYAAHIFTINTSPNKYIPWYTMCDIH